MALPFPTNTTTSGLYRPRIPEGRNAHLLPDIHARAKRLLMQAQQEHINANSSVVHEFAEVWNIRRNGKPCTCTKVVDEAYGKNGKGNDEYLDLKSFLYSKKITPQNIMDSCPMCFGTGVIGGYDLHGTQSIILDATNVTKLHQCAKHMDRPWAILTGPEGKAIWKVKIPKYFQCMYGVAVKWKQEPRKWGLYINDELLTDEALQYYAGQQVTITMDMDDKSTKDAGLYGIFMYFSTGPVMVNVNFPLLTRGFSGSQRVWEEIQESATANFDARISRMSAQDLFVLKSGQMFRIVQVEENRPLEVVISWNCECNLVRPTTNNTYYFIPSKTALHFYPNKDTTFIV